MSYKLEYFVSRKREAMKRMLLSVYDRLEHMTAYEGSLCEDDFREAMDHISAALDAMSKAYVKLSQKGA